MPTIRKLKSGHYQAVVRIKGAKTEYKTFRHKSRAATWALKREEELQRYILNSDDTAWHQLTVADAVNIYIDEYNQFKKSFDNSDKYRARTVCRFLGNIKLTDLTAQIVNDFKRQRLSNVSEIAARSDLTYLQRTLNYLRKDKQMQIPNVFEFIRLPSGDKQRERIPTFDELQSIIYALPPDIKPIAEIAVETAMRRSEILGIELRYLDLKSRTVTLPDTKNGTKRVVPLSSKAIQVLSDVVKESKLYRGKLFSVSPYRVTQQFRKACDSIGLHDVVFHSLRHYAATSFFERGLEMMEVACITGHKDVRMLRRYTHISASHLANKLG